MNNKQTTKNEEESLLKNRISCEKGEGGKENTNQAFESFGNGTRKKLRSEVRK